MELASRSCSEEGGKAYCVGGGGHLATYSLGIYHNEVSFFDKDVV